MTYIFNFKRYDGTEKILYYGDVFSDHRVNERSYYFQLPFNHPADIMTPPSWLKDAIVYNIFPDSFATGHRFISKNSTEKIWKGQITKGKLGGTIKGILDNIDYIKNMGFNCIYLNPIFAAGEYHKYDLIDYYHIDPCFGSDDDFRELVNQCHENGIKVIIDGVFNHVGWNFYAFDDVVHNGQKSKYKECFYKLRFPVEKPDNPEIYPTYECFGYERMMPKTKTTNPNVEKYFCDVGKYWVKEFGIDGWRLDVASEINDDFWRHFRKEVKSVNPECALIGEVWESAQHWLNGDIFDSTMNYDFRRYCKEFFADQCIDAAVFDGRVTNMRMRYKISAFYSQLNLLDSHDVSRFLSLCEDDIEKMKLAVLFQMTFIGAPSVFYGDEKGITGIEEDEYRQPMDWENKHMELQNFYKQIVAIRNKYEVLRNGNYRTLAAEGGLYAYARENKTDEIKIVINNQNRSVTISDKLLCGTILMSYGNDGNMIAPMGFVVTKR